MFKEIRESLSPMNEEEEQKLQQKKNLERLSTPKPNVCSKIKTVFYDFSKNLMNSSELEKLEENKTKPNSKKIKLENWGLREKIRY